MDIHDDNRGEALQILQDGLKNGIVHFCYAKTSGEVRHAFGTLNQDLMPVVTGDSFAKITTALGLALRTLDNIVESLGLSKPLDKEGIETVMEEIETLYPRKDKEAKKTSRTMPDSNQMYYDFDAKGFRSFKKDNLVKIY